MSLDGGGWNVVGSGSGMRVAVGAVVVGVGADVWECAVGVVVGLAMSCCVGGAEADLVVGSSGMIPLVCARGLGLRVVVGCWSSCKNGLVRCRCGV